MTDFRSYLTADELSLFDQWEVEAKQHKRDLAAVNLWRRQMMDRARARQRRGAEPCEQ